MIRSGGQGTEDLFRRLADEQERYAADPTSLDRVRRALLERAPALARRRPSALLAASVLTATAAGLALWLHGRPLQFQVGEQGAAGTEGATLVARADSELPLRFSDGSTVRFEAGAAGRVQRLTGSGADVVLDDGRLEAHVVHAERTSWVVRAGPFRIRVTGTRFSVTWSARTSTLSVALREGSVLVDGAVLGAGVPLRAGQALDVDLPAGLVRTGALDVSAASEGPAPDVVTAAGAVTATDKSGPNVMTATGAVTAAGKPAPGTGAMTADPIPALPAIRTPARSGSADRARGEPGTLVAKAGPSTHIDAVAGAETARPTPDAAWQAFADQGAHDEALAVAEAYGFARLCQKLDARRLLSLGDVARYAGAPRRARLAFESLVARFPNTALASDAVFSLGRLASEEGARVEAVRWFTTYADRWPEAELAEQAVGRLLELAAAGTDAETARRAATAYLARHPDGPWAALARRTLARPFDSAR